MIIEKRQRHLRRLSTIFEILEANVIFDECQVGQVQRYTVTCFENSIFTPRNKKEVEEFGDDNKASNGRKNVESVVFLSIEVTGSAFILCSD